MQVAMQREIGSVIPDFAETASRELYIRNILLIEVILDGHVGCGTATRGAAHLPQTYFVVSSELEWRPMA